VAGGDAAVDAARKRHGAEAFRKDQFAFGGLRGFTPPVAGRNGCPRHPAEMPPGRRERGLMRHSPGDHERGVVGHVVGVPEPANVGGGGRAQVGELADGQPAVRVVLEQPGHDAFGQGAVGRVEIRGAALFFDDAALGLEGVVADVQERHALGFEPEGKVELSRGDGVHVGGVVEIGVGIVFAAHGMNEVAVLIIADGRAAPEHQVLDEVGHALARFRFVFRARVVPHLNRNQRV